MIITNKMKLYLESQSNKRHSLGFDFTYNIIKTKPVSNSRQFSVGFLTTLSSHNHIVPIALVITDSEDYKTLKNILSQYL